MTDPSVTEELDFGPGPEDPAVDAPVACASALELPLTRCQVFLVELQRDNRERLHHAEAALRTLSIEDRLIVAAWIRKALERPPLDDAGALAWRGIRAVLAGVREDLIWSTPGREYDADASPLAPPLNAELRTTLFGEESP